jgi:hypothetical protein
MARNRPNRPAQNQNPYTGGAGGGGGGGGVNIYTGGGGGGGSRPRRPGGGGGGGKVPRGGLYGGKPGEAASNQDPEQYFLDLLSKTGITDGSGSAADLYGGGAYLQQMIRDYNVASADNQRLSAADWARQTYGAGWQGKRGKAFTAGTLSADDPAFAQAASTNYNNTNPRAYLTTQGLGGPLAQGGNDEFSRWYTEVYAPRLEAEYTQAQASAPGLNIADWNAQQEGSGRAQREYQGWRSSQDPMAWASQEARARGDLALNGNEQFANWYDQVYAPQLQTRFQAARTTNPNLNFNDYEAGVDRNEARRLFAHRAPQYRAPNPYQPAGGRWSWWS